MKQIKCPNCGSKVDPSTMICDYCGSYFEKKITTNSTKQVEPRAEIKTSNNKSAKISDDVLNSMLIDNSSSAGIGVIIVFMILWCSLAVFMGVSALSSGAPFVFGLVPMRFNLFPQQQIYPMNL